MSAVQVLTPGDILKLDEIENCSLEHFCTEIIERCSASSAAAGAGAELFSLFVIPQNRLPNAQTPLRLAAVLGGKERLGILMSEPLKRNSYPALTPKLPQAHLFEREISENWGILPEGHPWLKPLRFQPSLIQRPAEKDPFKRSPGKAVKRSQEMFYALEGEDMHAFGIGPVFGTLTEPDYTHFTFCGEQIYLMEKMMGYQCRQIETRLAGGPTTGTLHLVESIGGDSVIGHITSCVRSLEALGGIEASPRGEAIRALVLELSRMAMHVRTIAAVAESISFLPTVLHCKRIQDDLMDLIGHISGNRLGRHLIYPGGVAADISEASAAALGVKVTEALSDFNTAAGMLFDSPSAVRKFRCGRLTEHFCKTYAIRGVAARACNVKRDARADYPSGYYAQLPYRTVTETLGDVGGRVKLMVAEVQASASYILNTLVTLPETPVSSFDSDCLACQLNLEPEALSVSLTEGGRGTILHAAVTDSRGKLLLYKIVDPSFNNRFALAQAVREESAAGFPMISASFDLSASGHDL